MTEWLSSVTDSLSSPKSTLCHDKVKVTDSVNDYDRMMSDTELIVIQIQFIHLETELIQSIWLPYS